MDLSTDKIYQRVERSAPDRALVRTLVRDGRWMDAEPDKGRLTGYIARHVTSIVPPGAEAIQGAANELQAVRFLSLGSRVRRAVGYVEVTTATASEAGTGFLVTPGLFLTNAHVIADADAAAGAVVTFDRELDESGRPRATTSFRLDPEAFALFSDPDHLDYALIAVGQRTTGTATIEELGFCPLSDRGDKHAIGMPVNIIQHPQGWPKMVAIRNNLLTFRTDQTLLYETDTDQGSSGSPVFNDDWELIALHHWGGPHLQQADAEGHAFPATVNEGIRISSIYQDLEQALSGGTLTTVQHGVLSDALDQPDAAGGSGPQALSPPRPGPQSRTDGENQSIKQSGADVVMGDGATNDEIHITIPLDITIRVGGPATPATQAGAAVAAAAVAAAAPPSSAKVLTLGPEAAKVDKNYSNRLGFDPGFIVGHPTPLPGLKDPSLVEQLAPLRPEVPNADSGELLYEHFSVKVNKAQRMAIFTATNIDGPTYLAVDRTTGKVVSEGDTWFLDTRISASFVLDQTFYSGWSHIFDRGHLTRRSDPTWGTAKEAERANADTFHFTNASPQHFRFNESAKFWQGIERYVLENGVLETDPRKRLCVFQGPIFDIKIDRWADDVQIPSSFWKIVVWQGHSSLKAVGMVVDQLALLDQTRVSLGTPKELPTVDIQHWRVGIPAIEKRTGLDFGAGVRAADTIAQAGQPGVGAEAAIRVTRFEDILL